VTSDPEPSFTLASLLTSPVLPRTPSPTHSQEAPNTQPTPKVRHRLLSPLSPPFLSPFFLNPLQERMSAAWNFLPSTFRPPLGGASITRKGSRIPFYPFPDPGPFTPFLGRTEPTSATSSIFLPGPPRSRFIDVNTGPSGSRPLVLHEFSG